MREISIYESSKTETSKHKLFEDDSAAAAAAAAFFPFSFLEDGAGGGGDTAFGSTALLSAGVGCRISWGTGSAGVKAGELTALALPWDKTGKGDMPVEEGAVCDPGGGGRGAMPTLFLSAAAAAAEAYLRVSPTGRAGNVAGFMPVLAPPLAVPSELAGVLLNCASCGNGDLT